MLLNILIATTLVASLSLSGVFVFGTRGHLVGSHRYIIPAAIGVFLGVVFFELIPETMEAGGQYGSVAIAAGFLLFYLLSYVLHTFHHHHDQHCEGDSCEDSEGASMLLIGDTIHNFADGIVIASAFIVNPAVGIATTVGIALHEIPQEIAEFGVLLRAGYTKTSASLYNFLSATTVIVGGLVTLLFANELSGYLWVLTGLAAGNLLYIAASDLLPDVHEDSRESGRVVGSFIATVLGMIAIVSVLAWSHHVFGEHEQVPQHPDDMRIHNV